MTGDQPRLYLHETDAVLRRGDLVLPAATLGVRSRHADVPGYDPTLVYVSLNGTETTGTYGRYVYVVWPTFPLGPDPEVEQLKVRYRAAAAAGETWQDDFGAEPGAPWSDDYLGAALNARTTTSARVIYRR